MEAPVRPVFTILAKKEGVFVSAEIPGLDIAERPCFYAGKMNKPNLAQSSNSRILELMSMVKGEKPTLAAILLFGDYPQAYFPQLSIIAISVPGKEIADFLNIKTVPHAIKNHIMPLVDKGLIELAFPEKPRSSKQRYRTRQ